MSKNKHLSYNDIPDFQTDWEKDVTNEDKPFAGQSVQKFIKQQLQASYGYSRTVSGYIQFFRSADDADAYDAGDTTKLLHQDALSGTNTEFRFINQYQGNVYINGSNAYPFPVTVRSVDINSDGTETPHDSNVSLAIMVNLNNGTTTTDLGMIPANEQVMVNITPYVADGATFVLVASDDDGYRRTSSRYKVTRANLSLAFQNDSWWANAYRQGDTLWNVPLALNVNVAAELTATIRKDNVNYVTKTVPSSQFSSIYALMLDHPLAYGGESGVYELHLELATTDETLTGLAPETLDVNIFCVAADCTDNFLLVNNEAQLLQNYTNNHVMDYAVYIGSGNHTLSIEAKEDDTALAPVQTVTAVNGQVGSYFLNMEMERIDNADFTVSVKAHFDDEVTNVYDHDYTASNAKGYAATAGANLLVKMAGRSNSESNRASLINNLNGQLINPTWANMTWSSVDGYRTRQFTDSAGENVDVAFLRLLSGESMEMPIQPLKMSANQGRTLEIMFQVRNIMNYDTPVITCMDEEDSSSSGEEPAPFKGLRVTSSKITLLTAGSRDEDTQSKNFNPDDVIHMAIVVNPAYSEAGRTFSACFIYINGVKQRVFTYSKDLSVIGKLIFGSADADIDIYAVRTYNAALTSDEIVTNAVNWKFSLADKQLMKDRNNIKENGHVDFNKVRSLCNVFVFRANDGSGNVPTLGWGKKDTIPGVLRTYWKDQPSWDSSVSCDLAGQGTSSMEYFRWNFKTSFSAPWAFDGGSHTPIKKWCAKKNYASSMQSHKMGGTEAYDYLARACGAVENDADRQAIWQYPFVGFSEDGNGNMTFIGLYTVGPDKGDKDTFGFTSKTVAMEGLDNDRLATNFRVPWNDTTVVADSSNEKYTVCGELSWEDSMKNATGVSERWKPAYNFVYECSQLIKPWKGNAIGQVSYPATVEGLIAYGGDLGNIDTSTDEGRAQYEEATKYEFWIPTNATGAYDLYFYNPATQGYMKSHTTADVNLATELCDKGYQVGETTSGGIVTPILLTTALLSSAADDDARNELFMKARLSKFKKEASGFWDITNAFFHLAWVEMNAATDNLAKNTYPYLKDYTDANARFRWRQDDVDTVWPIDNQGKDKKPYCVELEDNYSDYGMASLWVWNGRFSQFWFTLKAAFADEYAAFVRTVFFQALHYGSASNLLQRVMDFYQHFYFDRAQEYFGAALYNADGIYCYEQAYLYTGTYAHKGIALEQLLGDHYSAEKYWIKMRIIYMMSKYCADLFAAGQTTDCFATRVGEGVNTYTITPAIYMYPVVQNGEQAIQGPRFWPGNNRDSWTAGPITTAGDQTFRINGMSYIRSIGDLYLNTLKESVSVAGQMLRQLNLGSRTADPSAIKSTVTAVAIDNATSLRTLDMAQLAQLAGTVNLSACANLRFVYAQDTALAAVILSDGGPLSTLRLGDSITTMQLLGKQMLEYLTVGGTSRLTSVEIANCNDYTMTTVLGLLSGIAAGQLNSLKLAFGTQDAPTVLTDEQIAALLTKAADSGIETKQFSGYVTKSSGTISGSTYMALTAINITYVGDVVPEITISSPDLVISEGACTVSSGQGGTFQSQVIPPTYGTPRFRLYNGDTLVPEEEGIATYNGVTLNCATGALTTQTVVADFAVKVSAYAGSGEGEIETSKVTVNVTRTVSIGGFTITGTKSYNNTGNNTLVLTPVNSNYNVPVTEIVAELAFVDDSSSSSSSPAPSSSSDQDSSDSGSGSSESDSFLRVTVASVADLQLLAAVLALPVEDRDYVLTVTATDANGNVFTQSDTLTVESVPVTAFTLSGEAKVTNPGSYAYDITNILPANYTRGIASLSASLSSLSSGAASVAVNGTTGVTVNVASMPGATEPLTLTVVATLVGGGTVTATKSISLVVINYGYVDLGLPSGLLWCTQNVGASSPEELGEKYKWGALTPDGSEASIYQQDVITGGRRLKLTYDTANVNMGSDWRMPYGEDIDELLSNTTPSLVTVNSSYCIKLTSNINGNYILLPAERENNELIETYFSADYRDSSMNAITIHIRWDLYTTPRKVEKSGGNTSIKYPIRAVREKPQMVDLGLPSGTLWADRNVGATSAEQKGLYFAWGETTGYKDAAERNTALGLSGGFDATSYNRTGGASGISADLTLAQDAANVAYGGDLRMPTSSEIQELIDNTNQEWATVNGVSGKKFINKSDNTKYIFIPVSGFYSGTTLTNGDSRSCCWADSYHSSANAYYTNLGSSNADVSNTNRFYGIPVRAVQTVPQPITPDEVDLGLPSGKLWASVNVGATTEDIYGEYFSWGNIAGHASSNGSTFDDGYDFGTSSSGPYASTPGASLSTDIPVNATYDAARANLGGNWRMPTKAEFQELYDNTDRSWTTVNGVAGYKFMKKSDHSVYVFFPAAGYGGGISLTNRGSYGYYWSSSQESSNDAYNMYFSDSGVSLQFTNYRFYGIAVRAIKDAPVVPITPDKVDLGLPSGKLWASVNVGATDQNIYGDYFSWGNIAGHASSNGSTFDDGYDFGTSSSGPYASTPGASLSADIASNDSAHDAALAAYGGNWRMPTSTEFQELYDNTDREWTTVNGVAGYKFMKKTDHSVYVFFPASGRGDGTRLTNRGGSGYYWSSSWNSARDALYLRLYSDGVNKRNEGDRFYGFSVRAIQDPPCELVDLGLPSGTLWADRNIGADSASDYGDYFSWGNIAGHASSNGSTFDDSYNFGSSTSGPYASTPGASLSADIATNDALHDAALAKWGEKYNLPTKEQFQELYDNTDNEWTSIDGVDGRKFMKKSDHSVFVFFPCAGYGNNTSLKHRGSLGLYWSSSLYSADGGYDLNFDSSSVNPQSYNDRYLGFAVRAVHNVPVSGPTAVDLGLPSGTKWADMNVGATSESDYGAYFSWGNIVGHTSSNGSTFDDGYNFGSSNSGPYASTPGASLTADIASNDSAHDAALANLGSPWRMPTKEEFQELYDNTDREWTTVNGVEGYKFMKKTDHSVYVFFPASGYGDVRTCGSRGAWGYYWSSSLHSASEARFLNFGSGSVSPQETSNRYYGYTVRPVQ